MKEEKIQEVKTKQKNQMWVVVLVAILVIALGCEFAYIYQLKQTQQVMPITENESTNLLNKEITENTIEEDAKIQAQENTKTYTYDNIKGTYELNKKLDDNFTASYSLYLYSDGTYVYDYIVDNHEGVMGNYIINGEEIILNKLFYNGSDITVSKAEGQIKLTINKDGSLTDKNNLLENAELSNIKLEKKSSSISKDAYSLSNYVNGYISYLEEESE